MTLRLRWTTRTLAHGASRLVTTTIIAAALFVASPASLHAQTEQQSANGNSQKVSDEAATKTVKEPGSSGLTVVRLRTLQRSADAGLAWLATLQTRRGAWTAHVGHKRMSDYLLLPNALSVREQESTGQGHLGVTSLVGLAYLAGGHLPGRGKYGKIVQRTVDYVSGCVQENGVVSDSGTRMYSHAFAVLFLAQVHGMVGGERTRSTLERAVQIVVDCQNDVGAWRYNAFTPAADLSVTVCQLQALRAARNIGIPVPRDTIDRATDYVLASRTKRGRDQGLFYYKIYGRGAYEKNREYAINAAGLTALYSAGVHEDGLADPVLSFLSDEYPQVREWYGDHYFFWYGNYYAAQAFFQAGGSRFERYYDRLSRDLIDMQSSDGRWRNRVGPGDAFSTAVAVILLQIPKQYLPIFQR